MAFFDVRVFNPIAKRYVHTDTSETYQLNEKEKKNYSKGILEVEHDSFTPIVISAYGRIEKRGNKFYNPLAELANRWWHHGFEEN